MRNIVMVGFSGILGTGQVEDQKIQWYFRYWLGRRLKEDERQINRWKKIVSRFKGKLVKMIKDTGSKFNDYSISPKIRQILLHWDYELT